MTRTVNGVAWNLEYGAENRLVSMAKADESYSESYLYDGDGVRVGRVRAGEATYLFMGGMYEVSVEIPTGTVTDTKSYSRTLRWGFARGSNTAAGQVVAVRDTDGLNVILTDHLGSILGEVDGLGTLMGEQRYLPFGEVRGDVGSNPSLDLSFTGQRALEGTGLIDYKARQYDPSLRSFIQPDPIIPDPYNVQDLNRYAYVHGNPVRFTDPSGNRIIEEPGSRLGCHDPVYCNNETSENIVSNTNPDDNPKLWNNVEHVGGRCDPGDFIASYCSEATGLINVSMNRFMQDGACDSNTCSFSAANFPINYSATYDVVVYDNLTTLTIYENYWFSGRDIPLLGNAGTAASFFQVTSDNGVKRVIELGEFEWGNLANPESLTSRKKNIDFFGSENSPSEISIVIHVYADNIGYQYFDYNLTPIHIR